MKEQPLVRHSDATQSDPPSRIGRGNHREQTSPLIAMPLTGNRFGLKQPHFALTPAKFQQAGLHRWKLALFVGLILGAGGFGLAWLTYAPKYTATFLMRMESGDTRLIPGNEDRQANREEEFRKTQSVMIKRREVLKPVTEKNEVKALTTIRKLKEKLNDPALWLEKELQAGFVSGTSIFRVSLSGEEPEDLQILVNEIANAFESQFLETTKKDKNAKHQAILNAIDIAEKKIQKKRDDFNILANILRTGDTQALTLQQRMALEEYGVVKKELHSLESEYRLTEAQLVVLQATLKSQENAQPPLTVVNEVVDRHPTVQKLQSELIALKARIQDYQKLVPMGNSRLTQYQEELKTAEAHLQKVRTDLEPDVIQKIRNESQRQRLLAEELARDKLQVISKQKAATLKDVNALGTEFEKIGRGAVNLEEWRAQIAETDVFLKKLLNEKERLEFEKENNSPTIFQKSPAIVPTINQSSFPLSASLFSIAGFFLGLLGVSFLEARARRVLNPTDVQRELGIETLGMVPLLDQELRQSYGRQNAASGAVPQTGLFTEAVNGLCATLICDDHLKSKAVIMLTSAGENEGKTLLATQIAAGFARAGRKTLLLDCDFRNPRCHDRIGRPIGHGLSEVLRGEVELADALQSLPECELHFLSAGVSDFQVIRSLSNGVFASLLERLRADFDYVIVDSAPTLVVSDGLLIGKLVDGVILVVRPKFSKALNVFSVYEQLLGLRIRILGAVVNGAKLHASSYYAR